VLERQFLSMRPLRNFQPDGIYFVSNRVLCRQLWLRPDPQCRAIIGEWLGRAVRRFEIDLFFFVFMSNHFHMGLRAPNDNVDAFMAYFQSNVARAINRLRGREGPLWRHRYSAIVVLDDSALIKKLIYSLLNPVAAGLVPRVRDWPGLSSWSTLVEGEEESFLAVDRSSWWAEGRPVDRSPFERKITIPHCPLPSLARLSARARRRRIRSWIERAEEEHAKVLASRGDRPGSPARVLLQHPSNAPAPSPKRYSSPYVGGTSKERENFRDAFATFTKQYREAARLVRLGRVKANSPVFPAGSYPSRLPRPWPVAAATRERSRLVGSRTAEPPGLWKTPPGLT